jgi:hypothetical protein
MIARWCRANRRSQSEDVENNVGGQNMLMADIRSEERHVIPFLELSNVCPIIAYNETPSMKNNSCAICLDDFNDDYYVRVLPCHHGYCTACIGK